MNHVKKIITQSETDVLYMYESTKSRILFEFKRKDLGSFPFFLPSIVFSMSKDDFDLFEGKFSFFLLNHHSTNESKALDSIFFNVKQKRICFYHGKYGETCFQLSNVEWDSFIRDLKMICGSGKERMLK